MADDQNLAQEILISRRAVTASGLGAILASFMPAAAQAQALPPTPTLPAGPNYPTRWQSEPLGDLVVGPMARGAQPFTLAGRVVTTAGAPVSGARVELWQCDGLGFYHHDNHSRPSQRDTGFIAYGWQRADEAGAFALRTIKAVPCENRTPHFHIAVIAPGRRRLITQIFVPDHPENAGDVIYRRMSRPDREATTAAIRTTGGVESGLITIVLA